MHTATVTRRHKPTPAQLDAQATGFLMSNGCTPDGRRLGESPDPAQRVFERCLVPVAIVRVPVERQWPPALSVALQAA